MPLPNLIIAGPPKTGTTSLFDWLAKHPEVLPSKVKETYYFYDNADLNSPFPNYKKDGWEKYESYFSEWKDEAIRMEASPGYIYSDLAAQKLGSIKGLRVIIVYRKASDRIFSEYQFNKFKTKKFNGSFNEYIGYRNGRFQEKTISEAILTPFIKNWLKYLDQGHFRIISFEELKSDPMNLMIKLSKYLTIDHSFYKDIELDKKNETFGLKNRKLHLLALKIKDKTPRALQEFITPIYHHFNKTNIPKITQHEKKLKQMLSEELLDQEIDFQNQFKDLFL